MHRWYTKPVDRSDITRDTTIMYISVFIIELVGLFILSRKTTDAIYLVLLLLTRSRTLAITALTLLLFPGTVIHELAHLFTAGVLGVRAGRLTLTPESLRGNSITLGSVSIAQSDPFRRYLIGLSPIGSGTLILGTLSYFFMPMVFKLSNSILNGNPLDWVNLTLTMLIFYLLFSVSNTMFSSPEDVKGFFWFLLVLIIIIGTLLLASGLTLNLSTVTLPTLLNHIFELFSQAVGLVMIVNILLYLIFSLISITIQKILHIRLK